MLILASQSPRRRELLSLLTSDFAVRPAECDETCDSADPAERVLSIARKKCAAAAAQAGAEDVVIAADTLVFLEGQPLGKPRDAAEACAMLRRLSGRTHLVCTGVAVRGKGQTACLCQQTEVTFYPLTESEIRGYVATGEPMDKAGAYGIQGKGALLVAEIRGDYYNVVGLPVSALARLLRERKLWPEERTEA